jgi:hypothetical protein
MECRESYTIAVTTGIAKPTVTAYWTMSETGTVNDRVDSAQSIHLVQTFFGNVITNAPGKIGNGLAYPAAGSLSGFDTGGLGDARLALGSNGWSIVLWFNQLEWPRPGGLYPWGTEPEVIFQPHGAPFSFVNIGWDRFGNEMQLSFLITDDNGNDQSPAAFSPTLNTWYFLHLFYDKTMAGVGYSINNGSPVFAAGPVPLFGPWTTGIVSVLDDWGLADTPGNATVIDEVAFKLDRNLSNDEVSYLYNSGNGRTWPL